MNNSDDSSRLKFGGADNVMFLVRWRGKQEGPYSAAVIENMLATNQIGLLHEILHEGRWITIRNYMAQNEAIFLAERQAREEVARLEADKQARLNERQTQSRDELLAEEKRNEDLLKSVGGSENITSKTWHAPGRKDMRLIYGVIVAVILLAAIGAYTFIQMKTQAAAAEAARIQAEQQAEAVKAAAKAQENTEAMKAAASIINTAINGTVEANKPVSPVIINTK